MFRLCSTTAFPLFSQVYYRKSFRSLNEERKQKQRGSHGVAVVAQSSCCVFSVLYETTTTITTAACQLGLKVKVRVFIHYVIYKLLYNIYLFYSNHITPHHHHTTFSFALSSFLYLFQSSICLIAKYTISYFRARATSSYYFSE